MPVNLIRISNLDDDCVAEYRSITDPDLFTRRGLFVAEGRLVIERLLDLGRFQIHSLLVTETALAHLRDRLEAARKDVPVYVVPQPVMNVIAGFDIHRGCLALAVRPPLPDWRELIVDAKRLVILERVGNIDNVGSMFRNAAAFGVDGILLGPACSDPLYRKSIRTSMGAALTVPYAKVSPWPEALREMQTAGFAVVALTPAATAPPLREIAVALANQRVALLLGHEGEGLTPAVLETCNYTARIPVSVQVDSLNVATAAAIALYELNR